MINSRWFLVLWWCSILHYSKPRCHFRTQEQFTIILNISLRLFCPLSTKSSTNVQWWFWSIIWCMHFHITGIWSMVDVWHHRQHSKNQYYELDRPCVHPHSCLLLAVGGGWLPSMWYMYYKLSPPWRGHHQAFPLGRFDLLVQLAALVELAIVVISPDMFVRVVERQCQDYILIHAYI